MDRARHRGSNERQGHWSSRIQGHAHGQGWGTLEAWAQLERECMGAPAGMYFDRGGCTPPPPPTFGVTIHFDLTASVRQGYIRREGTPEAFRQAVGGGCQSGWGRLLSVTNAIEAGTWLQGDSGWA